ncbi:MAG: class I SAM-dependent methyltransferase [Pseudomonadota bacterium]
MRRRFDKAYYDRFYRDPRTRAVTPADSRRQAAFIAGYLEYLRLPVRRIVDLGCGTGATLRALGRRFPRARLEGVEISDYLCRRYGWRTGSVVDYSTATPFDLVICNDVLAYLDDRDGGRAIANLARLCRGALFVGVLTADDLARHDGERSDPYQYHRPAAWYRRRLGRHFLSVGGGLYLKRPVEVTVWALEQG